MLIWRLFQDDVKSSDVTFRSTWGILLPNLNGVALPGVPLRSYDATWLGGMAFVQGVVVCSAVWHTYPNWLGTAVLGIISEYCLRMIALHNWGVPFNRLPIVQWLHIHAQIIRLYTRVWYNIDMSYFIICMEPYRILPYAINITLR